MYKPYNYSHKDKKLISMNYKYYTDWKKKCFNYIKEKMKRNLHKKQGGRCYYCKSKLNYAICDPHLDHILDKKHYERFGFHTKNLTLTCPKCNNKKSITNVLKKNKLNKYYPRKSEDFTIVHPYFDDYNDHLEKLDDLIITWKTQKGKETIKVCKLDRIDLVIGYAEEKGLDKKDKITKLAILLTRSYDPQREKVIKNQINDTIKKIGRLY